MLKKISLGFQSIKRSFRPPTLTWELGLYLLIVAGAAFLRFWQLDLRPIHYDEGSFHIYQSWQLSMDPHSYHVDPTGHGPVLYLLNALVYVIFWPSDYTSRIMPALLGTILVFLPYFLRRELGRPGALVASLLLSISPTMLFVSRFIRHDIYDVVWTLMLVICAWRYMQERRVRYIYIGAAVMALGFATMETFYFTVAILSSFLLFISLKELWSGARNRFKFSQSSPRVEFVILLGTLALPQLAAGLGVFQRFLGVTLINKNSTMGGIGEPLGDGIAVAIVLVCLFIVISAIIGWRWNLRRWLVSAVIFYFIYAFFYTTFFYNFDGFGSGIWRSLGYWLVQHGQDRLYQPWYFYIMMLSVYEIVPLVLAVGGIFYFSLKRGLFTTFLMYWFVVSMLLFAWAGEKAPWLVVHITLPMILLGSKFCGDMLGKAIDVNLIRDAFFTAKSGMEKAWEGTKVLARNRRLRVAGAAAMASVLIFALVFTARASWRDNFRHEDDRPKEMLDYAQVSFDVSKVLEQIGDLARQTGKGRELKITVDNNLWWPLAAWDLRDYKVEGYGGSGEPQGDVLLLASEHQTSAEPYLDKYGEGQRFKYLIWFGSADRTPTKFKGVWPMRLDDGQGWRGWWDYLTSRRTSVTYSSTEGIAYFPK